MILDLDRFFNLKSSLTRFFLFLATFVALATYDAHESIVMTQVLIIAAVSCISIYVLRNMYHITVLNPLNFFITALIIHVLLHPGQSIIYAIIAILIVALSKTIKGKSQSLFNPAALGLIGAYYASLILHKLGLVQDTMLISWWGADLSQSFLESVPFGQVVLSALLLITFIYFALEYRKQILIGMFFMTVVGCVYLANITLTHTPFATFDFLLASLFNSFAFMMCVMIPEPKTSPSFMKQQALVGVLGGFLFYLLIFIFPGVPNGFLVTILGMNVLTYGLKQGKLFQK